MNRFSAVVSRRDLWLNLTLRELRSKYRGSVIGWGWSLLNPLATMAIFAIVFGVFLQIEVPPGDPSGLDVFPLFLLCALLPWNFLSNVVNTGMATILANANLIKKVWFPRELLVAGTVASWVISLLIELAVLAVALLVAGNMVLPYLPVVLVLVALLTVFAMGIGMALSVMSVYFRDVPYLVGLLLQVWFYATPIVYPPNLAEDALAGRGILLDLYRANPTFQFVDAFRDLLYDLRLPSATTFGVLTLWAAGSMVLGTAVFARFEPSLAEEL